MSIAVSHQVSSTEQVHSALKFVAVGTAGTALYLGMYAAAGTVLAATVALVLSWTLSTLITNVVHRRVTFQVTGRRGATADAVVSMLGSLLGLAISTVLVSVADDLSTAWQLSAVITGTAAGGVLRFVMMQAWLGWRTAQARRFGQPA